MGLAIVFAAGRTASRAVASVPAIARALREVALARIDSCTVCIPEPWRPSAFESAEIARLAPGLKIAFALEIPANCTVIAVGEALVPAVSLRAALAEEITACPGLFPIAAADHASLSLGEAEGLLRAQGRAIIAATGKPGDGIVSRKINRPVSQTITRFLLYLGPVRPYQATFGTALLSIAMAAVLLLFPGYHGLLWGALLFQMASIFDGVDGEIARATFRATDFGATFDSMVDATTNLSFFACMMINLYLQGETGAAMVGTAGLCGLALGMTLLGMAASNSGAVTFNAVKERVAVQRSRVMTFLTWLTMRDFYAFAFAVLIALDVVVPTIFAFTTIVAGWLCVVLATLLRARVLAPQSLDG